jgi:hypothetical protein
MGITRLNAVIVRMNGELAPIRVDPNNAVDDEVETDGVAESPPRLLRSEDGALDPVNAMLVGTELSTKEGSPSDGKSETLSATVGSELVVGDAASVFTVGPLEALVGNAVESEGALVRGVGLDPPLDGSAVLRMVGAEVMRALVGRWVLEAALGVDVNAPSGDGGGGAVNTGAEVGIVGVIVGLVPLFDRAWH